MSVTQSTEEMADEIGALDATFMAINPDKCGVAIEWHSVNHTPTEIEAMIRDELDVDFDFVPLDGAAETMYQYYVQVSEP